MAKENLDIVNPNPLVDTSEVTTDTYIKLKDKGLVTSINPNKTLGETDTKWYTSPNFKAQVYVYTPLDKQYHRYWTSMNIDVQVQDFMGTCELHAPYDSDLMAYWQPIAQICIVYGSNNGPAKVLFVGRVREVKQDGYECVVTLQNYGWKFQQDAPAKFVEDNVTNKDGLTILLNIFEILKIQGYTISENAQKRLKEVGINSDGNLTLNGKEIEEMPDLLDRLKSLNKADMTTIMGKKIITEKEREDEISWADVYNLNYTLRYSEPTAVMTQLNNSSNYSAGSNVYSTNYSKSGTSSQSSSDSKSSSTKTNGVNIWTEISIIVNKHIKVSKGKTKSGEKIVNQYIRRLVNADNTWKAIAKITNGHQIVGSGLWSKTATSGQNLAIRTILYIKKDKLTAEEAYKKALIDEKAKNGDLGAGLQKAGDSLNSWMKSHGLGSLY